MDTTRLAPTQQAALDELLRAAAPGRTAVLLGGDGTGKTTLLHHARAALGARLLTARDLMDALAAGHPLALDEAFHRLVWTALDADDAVLVDDFHVPASVTCCGTFYPRQGLLHASLAALAARVAAEGKRLVLAGEGNLVTAQWSVPARVEIRPLTAGDYRAVAAASLPAGQAEEIDWEKVFRFARRLSARQLRRACETLPDGAAGDTEAFIDHLRARQLASNVDLGEVQAVDLADLKGVDEVIQALEANVILPLENDRVAAEFGLRPKRGVLLAGPPGTGKTTIGRALAHRLRSKFFLLDGTVIAGTAGFYQRVQQIFEAARQNAPAVVFIDDSDVIFESGGELGLYRYLLTLLDGIESESAGQICLMMTAMDVGSLPPALVRSGRIELWLEMRLPDVEARAAILADRCADLPAAVGPVDVAALAAAAEGLTGADLKRLVEDGKILFAYDHARGEPVRPATEYFLRAMETVRANKERYAEAEARARARRPERPAFFDMIEGFTGGFGPEGAGGNFAFSVGGVEFDDQG